MLLLTPVSEVTWTNRGRTLSFYNPYASLPNKHTLLKKKYRRLPPGVGTLLERTIHWATSHRSQRVLMSSRDRFEENRSKGDKGWIIFFSLVRREMRWRYIFRTISLFICLTRIFSQILQKGQFHSTWWSWCAIPQHLIPIHWYQV